MLTPVEKMVHDFHSDSTESNTQPNATEMNTEFTAKIMADQPIEYQPRTQQQSGSTAESGNEAKQRPEPEVFGQAHTDGTQNRYNQSGTIEPVFEHQITHQRRDNSPAKIPNVINGRQPTGF